MTKLARRRFLQMTGAGALGASLLPRQARADGTWAAWSGAAPGGILGKRYNVLEIALLGALSPWETFYKRAGVWFDQQEFLQGLMCDGASSSLDFGMAGGDDIAFGPPTRPLWHLADRIRVITQRHDTPAHRPAYHLAFTGLPFGNARAAGLGAHIQRFRASLHGTDSEPYAFVIDLAEAEGGRSYANVGNHGGAHRPVVLTADALTTIQDSLARTGLGPVERDAALAYYRDAYAHQLSFSVFGNHFPARSPGFDAYRAAVATLGAAPQLQGRFPEQDAASLPVACGPTSAADVDNINTRAITQAGLLFDAGANYVGIVDRGVHGGFAYDTHDRADGTNPHVDMYISLHDMLSALAKAIDGGAIDLSETLVAIKTEFGRTPYSEETDKAGRDHWSDGYVCLFMGGPVTQRGIVGVLDDQGKARDDSPTPVDYNAAVLLAAGIYPIQPHDIYSTADFYLDDPLQTEDDLIARALGLLGVVA